MTPGEFAQVRALTGCNRDQFAKAYGITVAKQKAYEKGKRISEDDEAYLLKIANMYENGRMSK